MLERLRIIASRLADEAVWIASRVSGVPASLELTQRRMMGGFLDITRRLLLGYTPGLYDGSLVLFVAAEAALDSASLARLATAIEAAEAER